MAPPSSPCASTSQTNDQPDNSLGFVWLEEPKTSSTGPSTSMHTDLQPCDPYYLEVDQKLHQSGISDSIRYIIDLDKTSFMKYKNNSGFTDEQKDLITKVRHRAQTRERTRKLRHGPYNREASKGKTSNDDSNSVLFRLDDLDAQLVNVGITESAEEIANMTPDEYMAYKNYAMFSEKELEVLAYVRYRIKERKKHYTKTTNRIAPSFQSELQCFVQKLKKAGIAEKLDDIRAMTNEDFARYIAKNKFNHEQIQLLMEVWKKAQGEKELEAQVQRILYDNDLTSQFTVFRLKKLNKVRYLKYTSPEYKEFTEAQKNAIIECLSMLRPKFVDDCEREMEKKFSGLEDPNDQDTLFDSTEDDISQISNNTQQHGFESYTTTTVSIKFEDE